MASVTSEAPETSGDAFEIVNPADPSEVVSRYIRVGADDVRSSVDAAAAAFPAWESLPPAERRAYLDNFLGVLKRRRDEIATVITREMGKAFTQSRGEIDQSIQESRYMLGEAERGLGDVHPSRQPKTLAYTRREPLGVVGAITPWNFPLMTPLRKVVPALLFGNTVVLKPAMATPGAAVAIADMFREVGLPDGVFQCVITDGRTAQEALVGNSRVAGISFTGSTSVGRAINQKAAEQFTRVQLEMGGKNAALVFDLDDTEQTAGAIARSAFAVTGQRCTAVSRVVVLEELADSLVDALTAEMESIVVGDGLQEGVTMGPLVSRQQLDTVREYLALAEKEGCRLHTGGQLTANRAEGGFFTLPTIVDGVSPDSRLAKEEIFGPVVSVIRVADVKEAVDVCNAVEYGLSTAIFSNRLDIAHDVADKVKSGMVHVNVGTFPEPHMPFGGVKESGLGPYGVGETARDFFTQMKATYVRYGR